MRNVYLVVPGTSWSVRKDLQLSESSTDTFQILPSGDIRSADTGAFWAIGEDQRITLSDQGCPFVIDAEGYIRTEGGLYVDGTLSLVQRPYRWHILNKKDAVDTDHHVIVARYREDVRWVRFLPCVVLVFNKGQDDLVDVPAAEIVPCENRGREGETYLSYILKYYRRLPQRCTFLQGDPFPHSPDILLLLCNQADHFHEYQSLSMWYIRNRIPPSRVTQGLIPKEHTIPCPLYVIDNSLHMIGFRADGGIEHCIRTYQKIHRTFEPIVAHFLRRAGLNDLVADKYHFSIAALFSCTKTMIKKRTKGEWARIRAVLLSIDDQGGTEGYILERLWHTLLTVQA